MDLNAIVENFRDTVTQHYFDMNGRVSRERFWYFVLAAVVVEVVAAVLQSAIFMPIGALVSLALLLPSAGMGARRLQDTGRNGNLVWIMIIPAAIAQFFRLFLFGPFGIFGMVAFAFTLGPILSLVTLIAAIVLIYYWCQPGDAGPNVYGEPPPQGLRVSTPPAA
jgi:uncharacterized membrane protein YhaH (DUF805 family)